MGILIGHAIPTLAGMADHTYVTCSGGYAWPCWGRSAGGYALSSGRGSTERAHCLSKSDSHAGLIYGITGVCHQTANRILWPAQVTVRHSKGYWASHLIYGTYGTSIRGWLNRLNSCSSASGEIPECVPTVDLHGHEDADNDNEPPADELDKAYLDDLRALYEDGDVIPEPDISRGIQLAEPGFMAKEVELAVKYLLGRDTAATTASALQEVQMTAVKEVQEIGQAVADGQMKGREMAYQVNTVSQNALNSCTDILGAEDYVIYMGLEPREELGLVDPVIAERIHG